MGSQKSQQIMFRIWGSKKSKTQTMPRIWVTNKKKGSGYGPQEYKTTNINVQDMDSQKVKAENNVRDMGLEKANNTTVFRVWATLKSKTNVQDMGHNKLKNSKNYTQDICPHNIIIY